MNKLTRCINFTYPHPTPHPSQPSPPAQGVRAIYAENTHMGARAMSMGHGYAKYDAEDKRHELQDIHMA